MVHKALRTVWKL